MTGYRRPDLANLELLVLVADQGSLGRAARLQGITQASASRRLDTLERELGVPLLHRSTSGSRPTPQGQVVIRSARAVLAASDLLRAQVRAIHARRNGSIGVAASMTIAEYLMPAWLAALRRTTPHVEVDLRVVNSHQVCQLARNGQIDLGFIESPATPRDLATQRVAADRMEVVVSPRHPWAKRRVPLRPAELAATPLVVREPGSGTREALQRALSRQNCALSPALQLPSNAAVKVAVQAGVGPAVLSALAVAAELREGRLVAVTVSDLDLTRTLRAVWNDRPRPAAPVAHLLRAARAASKAP